MRSTIKTSASGLGKINSWINFRRLLSSSVTSVLASVLFCLRDGRRTGVLNEAAGMNTLNLILPT